jgi:PAS domain S-box-containing protein
VERVLSAQAGFKEDVVDARDSLQGFGDWSDSEALARLLDRLHGVSGMSFVVMGVDGDVAASSGWEEPGRLEASLAKGRECLHRLLKGARDSWDDFALVGCGEGLWSAAAPIEVQGEVLAMLLAGGFVLAEEAADGGAGPESRGRARASAPICTERQVFESLRLGVEHVALLIDSAKERRRRKQAESRGERRTRLAQYALDAIPTPIFHKDAEGLYTGSNQAFEAFLGKTREEIAGKRVFDISPGELAETYHIKDLELMTRGGTQVYEHQVRFADGSLRDVIFNKAVMTDEAGRPEGVVGVMVDVTAKNARIRELEQELREVGDLRQVIERSKAMVFLWRVAEGWPVDLVTSNVRQLGYEPGEFLEGTVSWPGITHPDDVPWLEQEVAGYLRDGVHEFDQEYRLFDKEGRVRWVEDHTRAVLDGRGRVTHFQGVIVDVTDRKLAEAELAEHRRRLEQRAQETALMLGREERASRALMDAITESAFLLDVEGRFLAVNRMVGRRLGVPAEELVGKSAFDFISPELAESRRARVEQVVETGEPVRFEDQRGGRRIDQTLRPVLDQEGRVTAIAGFGRDVTEERRALEQLQTSEERFRRALAQAPIPVGIVNEDEDILLVSRAFTEITGYALADIPTLGRWAQLAYGEQASRARSHILEIMQREERVHEGEFEVMVRDGERRIWDFHSAPLGRDLDGRKTLLFMAMDVTRRKQAEQELARSNQELEQFAYAASHDLREPLRKAAGFIDLLQRRYQGALDEKADSYIQNIADAADRMQRLIEDLLLLSQVGRTELARRPVDLSELLEEVVQDLDVAFQESGARLEADPLPVVSGEPTLLRMLLQNLVSNALKFHKPNQAPEVAVTARSESDRAMVTVADRGVGFEPDAADRVFGVFQRLHPGGEYPGSGVGLAVCQKIVHRHGGEIRAEAVPGEGAAFTFTLPLAG